MLNKEHDVLNDTVLLSQLKSGSENALSEIYKRYWSPCYDIAYFILQEPHLVEDVLHNVFLSFWKSRKKIFIQQSLKGYLAQSIRYECYRMMDKQKRYFFTDELKAPSAYEDLYDSIDAQEMQALYKKTLQNLPEKSRLIFLLSREQELSYMEIARKLGLSTKAVEYHISKVLKVMKRTFPAWLIVVLISPFL